MTILKNRSTRALILIMCALVLISLSIAYLYYKNINSSVDPRIVGARTLYEKYNGYALVNNFDSLFYLMDTIEHTYTTVPHYSDSYEVGVLYNNRAAAYLTMAVYDQDIDSLKKDSILHLAEINTTKSIEIYEKWIASYADLDENAIFNKIGSVFKQGLNGYHEKKQQKFLKNRVQEIEDAQIETSRRLSVSYTNLGLIYRHREDFETAAMYYQKAIELWDRNLTAENNLNIILRRPLKTRTLIEKLFPPEKD